MNARHRHPTPKTGAPPPTVSHGAEAGLPRVLDCFLAPPTAECCRLAAGAAAAAAAAVAAGEAPGGAAIIRPPGHHAESGLAMGFCLLNNAAVAARAAQAAGAARVLILDWDVHHGARPPRAAPLPFLFLAAPHGSSPLPPSAPSPSPFLGRGARPPRRPAGGQRPVRKSALYSPQTLSCLCPACFENKFKTTTVQKNRTGNGTQEIFEADDSVLYMSLHRHDGGDFFPGTGAADEAGTGAGEGFTVNVPWGGPGAGDADYIAAFTRLLLPIAYEFGPDVIIVSAGFDAAAGDPLGGCRVSPECFGHMTALLQPVAPLALLLEGGYNLAATARGVEACVRALLGEAPAPLPRPLAPTAVGLGAIARAAAVHSRYWRCLAAPLALPRPGSMGLLGFGRAGAATAAAAAAARWLPPGSPPPSPVSGGAALAAAEDDDGDYGMTDGDDEGTEAEDAAGAAAGAVPPPLAPLAAGFEPAVAAAGVAAAAPLPPPGLEMGAGSDASMLGALGPSAPGGGISGGSGFFPPLSPQLAALASPPHEHGAPPPPPPPVLM